MEDSHSRKLMVRYERVILIRDRRTHHCDVGRLSPLAIICTNYFS